MSRRIFFLFLFLCLSIPVHASNAPDTLSFAHALFDEGDFYRAITEYKRFIHFHPDDPRCAGAALRIAESYFGGKRWKEAENALEKFTEDYPATEEARKALLFHAEIPFRTGDFITARQRYTLLAERAETEETRKEALYRTAWTFAEENDFVAAQERFRLVDIKQAQDLAGEMERLNRLPRKSPAVAGGLSALLPGAGQLYTGRSREAALAFLLNAAFIGAAIEAFDAGNEILGGILLFFEAGWYGGNIFNAVNSAHKTNRDRLDKEKDALRSRFGVTLGFSGKRVSIGVGGAY